jgi:hypothetical protein
MPIDHRSLWDSMSFELVLYPMNECMSFTWNDTAFSYSRDSSGSVLLNAIEFFNKLKIQYVQYDNSKLITTQPSLALLLIWTEVYVIYFNWWRGTALHITCNAFISEALSYKGQHCFNLWLFASKVTQKGHYVGARVARNVLRIHASVKNARATAEREFEKVRLVWTCLCLSAASERGLELHIHTALSQDYSWRR